MKARATLAAMEPGRTGRIVEVHGGRGLVRRLEAMGIRPGAGVTKTSGPSGDGPEGRLSRWFGRRGPVTLRVGNAQIALGFGMAKKVLVELEDGD